MSNTARFLCALLAGCSSAAATQEAQPVGREIIELAEAKLLIEHNATDQDTGFQAFVDGEPWDQLAIRDPDGNLAILVSAKGPLKHLGLTELFFETDEPENLELPIPDLLALMPAGDYDIVAKLVDGGTAKGVATLSHTIPAGPLVSSPGEDEIVSADADLVFRWSPGATPVFGAGTVTITHYQLIVSKLDQEPGPGFGAETVSIHVPASVTTMRVPHEFLQPDTDYEWELLAIEAGGNQTITAGTLSTR